MRFKDFMRLWWKSLEIWFKVELMYKFSFFLLVSSLFVGDIIIPVVSAIIYSVSSGIPGWSLYEFIVFQGTLITVMGIWHAFFSSILGDTISFIDEGQFDKILIRPLHSLSMLLVNSLDAEGLSEVFAGLLIVGFGLYKLHVFSIPVIPFIYLILVASVFELSLTIIASSLAFTFVKTWRLYELISMTEKFVRYPLDIYKGGMRMFLTFIVPAAVASYYPAAILLGKWSPVIALYVTIPVAMFFGISLLIWNYSVSKYTSAGG